MLPSHIGGERLPELVALLPDCDIDEPSFLILGDHSGGMEGNWRWERAFLRHGAKQ
jgi:hypothetical protein